MVGEKFKVSSYQKLKAIYVQSPKMVQVMEQKGFTNVFFVPNSKQIDYFPNKLLTKQKVLSDSFSYPEFILIKAVVI